jgi:hypothetical protein
LSELRGAQRLRAAGFRTLDGSLEEDGGPRAADPAIERLATWLNEHAAVTFETASTEEVVDQALRQLEFALDANRKFCDLNGKLDRVVSATVRELRAQGFVQ